MLAEIERGWRWVRLEAEMGFEEVGVMAALLDPLREAGVSILALSTFSTDHILVKETDIPRAEAAWREAGFSVRAS